MEGDGGRPDACAASSDTTSYDAPAIADLSGDLSHTTSGADAEIVTITGTNFGPALTDNIDSVYQNAALSSTYAKGEFSASGCAVSVAHTEIMCTSVEGAGKEQHWCVTAGDQTSAAPSDTTSYIAPAISGLSGTLLHMTSGADTRGRDDHRDATSDENTVVRALGIRRG